jgi:hypothetical protein
VCPADLNRLITFSRDVRFYIAGAIGQMLKAPQFIDGLPGYLLPDSANQARINQLLARLKEMAELLA